MQWVKKWHSIAEKIGLHGISFVVIIAYSGDRTLNQRCLIDERKED